MLRFVLLLVFAFQFNPQQDRSSINLLVILVGTGILVAWAWLSGGVYVNWRLDALETSCALNLIILVGATFYVKHARGNQLAVGYTSVFIAFATFTMIPACLSAAECDWHHSIPYRKVCSSNNQKWTSS